ncbi:MAG: cell division protein ZapA [Ruminococcus sp.]|nr:cell division protein ZapA [Ruminococcus sp.]
MENNKIKVSVFVAGQRFNIITDKSEKYVRDIADEIDARINSLVLSQNMSRERAAVLTALDYADDSELDKENISAVKEQMKDYLREIEQLKEANAKLVNDYHMLKAEYERLIEQNRAAADTEKALAESQEQVARLQKQVDDLKEQLRTAQEELEAAQQHTASPVPEEEAIPLPEEPPEEEEKKITAEDDLFFDDNEDEVQVKPEKKKKNRHQHNHVNPYQKKAKQKEQGYTQQRQYSFFDIDED